MKSGNSIFDNDITLWDRMLEGDPEAYRIIYDTYADGLFRFGMYLTHERELVRDCIQDLFVGIMHNRSRLHRVDNVKAYLFIALRNNIHRSAKREKAFRADSRKSDAIPAAWQTPEDSLIIQEDENIRQTKISAILDSLTQRQREAIYYRYIENLSLDEIAEIMEMNYQSVQNLIQRSISKARKLFE